MPTSEQNFEKIWTYSSSRSSKVNDFGTNRKRICDFLFVINSNFGPILHRFLDTATYWLKIAYFSYPSLIRRPAPYISIFPLEFRVEVISVRKLESWATCGEGCMILTINHDPNFNRLRMIHPCDGQTDGQTDGR